jgi:hypothetical protein
MTEILALLTSVSEAGMKDSVRMDCPFDDIVFAPEINVLVTDVHV